MGARGAGPGSRDAAGRLPARRPQRPAYDWGVIDAAVDRLSSAGIKPMLMLDGPPPLWASGEPAARQPALPAERARVRELRRGGRRRATATAVDQYILWNEPNLPVWMQPQADCGEKRCTPGLAERLSRDGPRRVPGDPRGRPGARPC